MLAMIVFLCLLAFYIAFSNPLHLGIVPPNFTLKEVYKSEPWIFKIKEYMIELPEETIVIPVYVEGNFTGLTFQAEKGYVYNTRKNTREDFTGGFLATDEETYFKLKGETLFLPVEEGVAKRKLAALSRQLIRYPQIQGIGFQRIFLPVEEKFYLYLEKNGSPLELEHNCIPAKKYPWLITYFALLILIITLFIHILTLDLHFPMSLTRFLKLNPSHREYLVFFSLLGTLFLFENMVEFSSPTTAPKALAIIFYYAIFFLLFFLARRQLITWHLFGLNTLYVPRSIVLALVAVSIIVIFSSLKFPTGLSPYLPFSRLISLFIFYFSFFLGKELFWRGFTQTILERAVGKEGGLFLNVLLVCAFYFLISYLKTPGLTANTSKVLELLFFLPALSFLLGYIYQRSRNILSPALLHTLIFFLPEILVF